MNIRQLELLQKNIQQKKEEKLMLRVKLEEIQNRLKSEFNVETIEAAKELLINKKVVYDNLVLKKNKLEKEIEEFL